MPPDQEKKFKFRLYILNWLLGRLENDVSINNGGGGGNSDGLHFLQHFPAPLLAELCKLLKVVCARKPSLAYCSKSNENDQNIASRCKLEQNLCGLLAIGENESKNVKKFDETVEFEPILVEYLANFVVNLLHDLDECKNLRVFFKIC